MCGSKGMRCKGSQRKGKTVLPMWITRSGVSFCFKNKTEFAFHSELWWLVWVIIWWLVMTSLSLPYLSCGKQGVNCQLSCAHAGAFYFTRYLSSVVITGSSQSSGGRVTFLHLRTLSALTPCRGLCDRRMAEEQHLWLGQTSCREEAWLGSALGSRLPHWTAFISALYLCFFFCKVKIAVMCTQGSCEDWRG